MFRRKDEAYDAGDLLQDVMTGDNDDALIDTQTTLSMTEKAKAASSDLNASASKAPIASTPSAPSAAAPSASAAASVPSPAPAPSKPAPAAAAAFRPQQQAPAAARPAPAPAPSPAAPAAPAAPERSALSQPRTGTNERVLTVGHDIHLKGEISTCDRLVIDGAVDATLSDVHTVEISLSGSFKGTAEIQDAEISGRFEGDLIVNGRLVIHANGFVSGNVAYGEIEIERGGKLTGSIKTADEMKASAKPMKKAA